MTEPFESKVPYWRIEIVEPDDPDDQRCIFLHGDQGEVVGPMTVGLAQAWIDHFSVYRLRKQQNKSDPPQQPK